MSIEYGLFINNIVDFTIVGFTIFLVIKLFNSLRKKSEDISDKSVETPKQIILLTEIRDLLKKVLDSFETSFKLTQSKFVNLCILKH